MCAQVGIGHRDGHLSSGCSWIVPMAVDGHARGRIHSLAHSGQGVRPVINPVCMLLACLWIDWVIRSEEHTSELQSHLNLVCRLLLEKKKKLMMSNISSTR